MSGKTWKIIDVVVGLLGGACGLIGIVSGLKSANYDEEQQFKDFEERYGLTPIEKSEDH